jgi:hypothetical protein
MIVNNLNVAKNIEKYSLQLQKLLEAPSIKYSNWTQVNRGGLNNAAGVYHFYERIDEAVLSLYVGKAGFGGSNWNLYKRLSQHFQPSQANALIGKIKKSTGGTPLEIKESLCTREVYLQWLVISNIPSENLESELVWSECFCKSILTPRYTNA